MNNNKPTYQELLDKVSELEAGLAKTEWLYEKKNVSEIETYTPYYGDVTELNTERTILDNVGKETLQTLTSELMDLLDTSVAIYEKNGDYAFGVFNSGWCQVLEASSRKLCNTNDNKVALNCGKWHCHDDCWNNSAKAAIIGKKSTDIDCIGAIKLYAEPIFVGDEVIGVINIGYGNPPTDDKTLSDLSEKFCIDFDTLKQKALDYKQRPDFIVEIAKKRLKSVAKLIGEIVSKKQTEQELIKAKQKAEESEEKFSTIFNLSQSFICIADINTATFKYINPTFKRILGFTEKELLNKPFTDFIHPDDVAATIEVVEEKLKAGCSVISFENRYMHKDGTYCWLSWNSYPNPKKGITYAIAHDVTDRKEYQQKLQLKNFEYESVNEELRQANEELLVAKELTEESEKEMNLTLDATTDGIWKWNFVKNELFFSPNYYRMLGYNPNEFEANFENWVSLIHPNDREKALGKAEKWLEKKDTDYENTFRLRTKTNDYLWLISTGKVVERDNTGKAVRMIGNHINITRIKKAEQELLRNKKEFETWIQNTPVCTKKIDINFNLQFMSKAGIKELKVKDVNELYGAPYPFYFFPEPFQKKMLAKMKQVRESCKIMQIDGILSDTEGRTMWYNHILVPVENNKGKLDYILIISSDISERKRAEQELKDKNEEYEVLNEELRQTNEELVYAKEKAEQSDRLKTAFLNNLSHEIRTPLNAICGFSQRLNKPALSVEKRNSFISIIRNSSDQLLSIVSDILTISSLETRQEQLYIDKVYINEIIINTLANFRQQGINQNISIYAKQPLSDKQSFVYTDHTKVTQILAALLSNALKFTHEGSVEFGYNLKSDIQPAEIEFYVKDTGIGISKVLHQKIFNHFRQVETGLAKKYGGTGLGLSIAQGFVELLGGKIWVDSEPGKGSTFYFTIPYKPVYKIEDKKKVDAKKQRQKIVLVAEDEEFNFLFIEELLLDLNIKLIHAKNGREAVDICNKKPEIDLILMDIKMPLMNGYDAAKIIKKQRPALPIVAQSAYALNHEIEQYKDIFDDYMAKPIKEKLLIKITRKYLKIK